MSKKPQQVKEGICVGETTVLASQPTSGDTEITSPEIISAIQSDDTIIPTTIVENKDEVVEKKPFDIHQALVLSGAAKFNIMQVEDYARKMHPTVLLTENNVLQNQRNLYTSIFNILTIENYEEFAQGMQALIKLVDIHAKNGCFAMAYINRGVYLSRMPERVSNFITVVVPLLIASSKPEARGQIHRRFKMEKVYEALDNERAIINIENYYNK